MVKRLLGLFAVAAIVLVLTQSHSLSLAAKKKKAAKKKGPPAAAKVDICHATDSADLPDGGTLIVGHVINVSENAVDAHLNHGDSLSFSGLDDLGPGGLPWGEVAESYGLNLAGANCAALLP